MEFVFECELSWDDFEGDSHTRFCPRCEKDITNLSAMTRAEAREFMLEHRGREACVSITRSGARTVFADDPARRLNQQQAGLRQLVLAAAMVSPMLVLGCDATPEATAQSPQIELHEGGAATLHTPSHGGYQRYKAAQDAPCDAGKKSAVDRARDSLSAFLEDLFGDEQKFEATNVEVVNGGMLF